MVLIATSADFEAAHRQLGDNDKCGSLHGHNWHVDFVLDGEVTDSLGYLVNFSRLKDVIAIYDHRVILCKDDPLIDVLFKAGQRVAVIDENPTCENLARIICEQVANLADEFKFVSVTVWENDHSRATVVWTEEAGIR